MFIQIILILLILYKLCSCNMNTTSNSQKKYLTFPIHQYQSPQFHQSPQFYNPNNNNHYEFIGNLYNKDKNIMLKLYGGERIRHVWDYFIIYNNHSTETKIDLSSEKKRLEDLDSVYIEIFQSEFILYKNENKYKYYPYIFSA